MGDLQPIIDAISNEAEKKAEEIIKEAKEDAQSLYRSFEDEKRKKRENFERDILKEVDRIYAAENVQMRQLAKTLLLKAKADAVKKAAEEATKMLAQLPNGEYQDFLEKLYKTTDIKNGGVVQMNERDKNRIKKEIFAPSKVSDKCINTVGGFILIGEDVDYDMTFERLLEERYDEICDGINAVYEEEDAW